MVFSIKFSVKQIILITIGIFFIGVSINMFLGPHYVAAGGASGIGILVESAFYIDRALVVLILNVLLLVLAFFFLGKEVFYRSVIGSLMLPLALAITPEVMIIDDRLLSVIFGSAFFGAGVAILYKIEASSGGTTIPPLIFKKYFGLSPSIGLLCTDAVIVLFNIFVFGIEAFFLAILSIVITSIIMNYIETGLKKKKAVMVMSQNHIEEIKAALLEENHSSLTVFTVTGAHEENQKKMLMVILENREYPTAINKIDEIDEDCFVITYTISDVHGLGLSYQPIS